MNDSLYNQAKQIVLQSNNYSISHLQRKLQIGYNKASDLIQMIKESKTKIIVVGIGRAGGNVISHMYKKERKGAQLIAINTDAQALVYTSADKRLQIGKVLTQGHSTDMCPSVGKEAAIESYNEIKNILQETNMIFIVAGFGGGTGTGVAPVVAKIAKEMGVLVVSLVTKPFSFEGQKRAKIADDGVIELKKHTDSMIVIENDKLMPMIDKSLGLKESFEVVDATLSEFILNISEAPSSKSESNIQLNFEDLQTVFKYKGKAAIGTAEGRGENAVYEAIREAIKFPLINGVDISSAMCVLVILKLHPDFSSYRDIENAFNLLNLNDDVSIIFSTVTDATLTMDYVKVTIVASGFEKITNMAVNNIFSASVQ